MKWFWRLIGAVSREEWTGGLQLKSDEAIPVRYSGSAADFFRGCSALGSEVVVYVEAPRDAALRRIVEERSVPPETRIARGTVWPDADVHHFKATPELFEEMARLSAQLAAPEVGDHVIVYRGGEILVSAYDMGDPEVWINRSLASDQRQEIVDRMRGQIVKQEARAQAGETGR